MSMIQLGHNTKKHGEIVTDNMKYSKAMQVIREMAEEWWGTCKMKACQ